MSNKRYVFISVALIALLIILTIPLINISPGQIATSSNETVEEVDNTEEKLYLPIVMYHDIKKSNSGKDIIHPNEFESDLKYLKENNYTSITMEDLLGYVYEDKPLPEKPIMLTFDDGYLTTYRYAYPVMQEYDMKIVLSIIGKSTDDFTRVGDDHLEYAHLTWPLLNEMLESGLIEIQNHTYNLHKTHSGRIGSKQKKGESLEEYEKVLTEDLMKLQQEIIEMTGITPTTFTIPYGEYSDDTIEIIKKLGFKAALTCDYGLNRISKDKDTLFSLKRICRSHNYPIDKLLEDAEKTIKRK
ncbi:polysaccharide deacetylase family protein [Anaerocolumna sp. AGMB13020]|uniref:polysaccharide deacetylase family protein n=1 Tax=Anaerocolumna sp. AGMB13020 TaxID=3081750 RepID=UPI002955891B|nr:polysaccharide deacetylase family protein [Anaerocolumna sp. AGMB13020]WOO38058.1 polysaccharide deacetylase family protein [Anaerocolumna sp. AGMB13020]